MFTKSLNVLLTTIGLVALASGCESTGSRNYSRPSTIQPAPAPDIVRRERTIDRSDVASDAPMSSEAVVDPAPPVEAQQPIPRWEVSADRDSSSAELDYDSVDESVTDDVIDGRNEVGFDDAKPVARDTTEALRELGALIELDDNQDMFDTTGAVVSVDLSLTQATDDDLRLLTELTTLKQLDLSRTEISDVGLQHLVGLKELELLWLNKTQITDAGLKNLSGMTQLKSLGLTGTSITDEGLRNIKEMTSLEYLLLGNTRVSGDGLVHLVDMTNLEGLSLIGMTLDEEAVIRFKRTLPNCQVVMDPPREKSFETPAAEADDDSFDAEPDAALVPDHEPVMPEDEFLSVPVPSESSVSAREVPTESTWEEFDSPEEQQNIDEFGEDFQAIPEEAPVDSPEEPISESDRQLRDLVRKKLDNPRYPDAYRPAFDSRIECDEALAQLGSDDINETQKRAIRYRLSIVLANTGEIEAAMPYFIDTVGEAAAHYNVGVIVYENAMAASEQQFRMALKKNPDLKEAQLWLDGIQWEQAFASRKQESSTQQAKVEPPKMDMDIAPAPAAVESVRRNDSAPTLRQAVPEPKIRRLNYSHNSRHGGVRVLS